MPAWTDTDGNGSRGVDVDMATEATMPWPWRGFRICLRELAKAAVCKQNRPSSEREGECERMHSIVTDLSFHEHYFDAGINGRMFEQPCAAYDNLVALLRQPGMRRFHLALAVGGQERWDRQVFRSGRLQRTLAALGPDLERLTLGTDLQAETLAVRPPPNAASDLMAHRVALQTLLPPNMAARWPRLTTLHLYGLIVAQADLLELLAALPPSVQRIVLGELTLADGYSPWMPESHPDKNWRAVMYAMRDTLGWRARPEGERPRVTIWRMRHLGNRRPGRTTWADAAVQEFLYGDGVCPYGDVGDPAPNDFTAKVATEIRDAADPVLIDPTWDRWNS